MPHEFARERHYELEAPRLASPQLPAVIEAYAALPSVPPTADAVGLRDLWAALWRGKWIVFATMLVGISGALAFTKVVTPVYRARTSLQLEGFNNDQFLKEVAPISPMWQSAGPESYLQNEIKLLESETLAKHVADRLMLTPDPPSKSRLDGLLSFLNLPRAVPNGAQQRVNMVQKALNVRTSLQSQVIEIFYDAPEADLAAQGANAVASEFVSMNRQARFELAQDTTDWLNKQAAALKSTLDNSNRQLEEFARSSGLVFAGTQSTLGEDRMRQVQDALAKSEGDRAAKQARFEAAKANPDAVMSDALANGPLKQYQTDLQNLRRDLAQLQAVYTPTNYKVERVQAQIADTEKAIKAERQAILDELNTEYVAAQGLEKLLSQTYAVQLKMVQQQMEQERSYNVKKSEIDATQKLYESMLEKVKEAGAATALRTTNIRVIDLAGAPPAPYSPNLPMNLAIGFAAGILGGAALVLLRAGSDSDTVCRPGEASFLNVPELGVIPSARSARTLDVRPRYRLGGHRPARASLDSSLFTESFRGVLTSILFNAERNRGSSAEAQVLVVTSIDVMEGKTTVIANLGIAASERNQRVLLIDADLRRGRLHERLGVTNTSGVTTLLEPSPVDGSAERLPIESPVRSTHVPGLYVLPTGPGNTATPLYSSDWTTLLDRFRRSFDLILIDTPPMMLYADARLLGRKSEGVVIVVRANTKSRGQLKAAYEKLSQDRIPLLGTILNDWKMDGDEVRSYSRYSRHYQSS